MKRTSARMQAIRSIIHEIHLRSLWQVLGIYLVGSWIGFEVISGLTQGLGLPDWVPAFAVILFIIGLPIVLATAFVQEGPPQVAPAGAGRDPVGDVGDARPVAVAAEQSNAWLTWRRSTAAGVCAHIPFGEV
jgi:hypothetical protein